MLVFVLNAILVLFVFFNFLMNIASGVHNFKTNN